TRPQPTACETDDCYLAADTLRASINESVDPCDDFYAYVCGLSKRTEENVMEHMRNELRRWTMAALFATVVPKKNQTAWHKAAGMLQLYDLQMWLASVKLDLRDLRDDPAFDAVDSMVELSLVHGVPALLALRPDRLRFSEAGRLLTLSLNTDDGEWYEFLLRTYSKPESVNARFYAEYLRDYGIEDTAERRKLSQDIVAYDKEVTGILQLHESNEMEVREATVQEFAEEALGNATA
ncbi:hypothetical protein MTO96_039098, partial [Rhipicephalus appendiculatus]